MTRPVVAAAGVQDPALPWDGVLDVLRGWSGRGQLYNALAAVADPNGDAWSARDVQRRARRVLFTQLLPHLKRLPGSVNGWLDALPAQSTNHRVAVAAPAGRVDWPRTRERGWPPRVFDVRVRSRHADELLVTVLRWTFDRLAEVRSDAARVLPGIDDPVRDQLAVADSVRAGPPVNGGTGGGERPTARDLAAVRHSGRPWTGLADVAATLLTEDTELDDLARRLVLPDDDLKWRLFHLGCLGALLVSLRRAGCVVTWLRPLGSAGSGPAYQVLDPEGRRWDLWFEAAGMWRWYGAASPYRAVRAALPGAQQPLGADLALVRGREYGLLVECKYSPDASYVGRNGYEQALAYLTEARTGLLDHADAAVVGPAGVVHDTATVGTHSGSLTITDPSGLDHLVTRLLST